MAADWEAAGSEAAEWAQGAASGSEREEVGEAREEVMEMAFLQMRTQTRRGE